MPRKAFGPDRISAMTEDRHSGEAKRSNMSGSVRAVRVDSSPFFGSICYNNRPVTTWIEIKDHARSSYKLAEEHGIDARAALQQSFNLAVGSLCLDGDVYVVRHTVMVDHLLPADLEVPMHAVARAADQIEQSLPVHELVSDILDEVEKELA
ncbi:MAG: hypothetical protein JRF54_06575 [Deltaproteobacteria bacterium]|nr:hypothetical protein [Deltaproteobacteria bacterium]